MNRSNNFINFLIVIVLIFIVLLQVMSMIQSDRLYQRLNYVLKEMSSRQYSSASRPANNPADKNSKYPGDAGDWLVWRFAAEPANLNPLTGRDLYNTWITGFIFESLLERDPDTLEFGPKLAESYSVSADGLEITFRLRDDVHFSDGHPITADDVIFSYNVIIDPGTDTPNLAVYYQNIDHIEKINNKTIKFVLKSVYFKSLAIVSGMSILPEHIYKYDKPSEFNSHISNPVGSGPYVFEKWDVGNEVVLAKNKNYWDELPKINKHVFRFIQNEVAALQSLRSNKVDYYRVTYEQYDELSNDEEFQKDFKLLSYWTPARGYSYIGWNQNSPYFADKRVRHAMTHLLDRESINKYLLKGLGEIVTGPFYIKGDQYNKDIKPLAYDLEKARRLLEEAGWKDTDNDGIRDKDGMPFRFNFMISGSALSKNLGKILKDQAEKAGIQVDIQTYEWSVFEEKLTQRDFDAVTLRWGGTIEGDPYQIWHSSQVQGRGSNFVGFDNEEADDLIEKARVTLDKTERNKLYHRLHEIIHEEQPYTFLFTTTEKKVLDNRFRNVILHKFGLDELEWYVPSQLQRY